MTHTHHKCRYMTQTHDKHKYMTHTHDKHRGTAVMYRIKLVGASFALHTSINDLITSINDLITSINDLITSTLGAQDPIICVIFVLSIRVESCLCYSTHTHSTLFLPLGLVPQILLRRRRRLLLLIPPPLSAPFGQYLQALSLSSLRRLWPPSPREGRATETSKQQSIGIWWKPHSGCVGHRGCLGQPPLFQRRGRD